MLTTHPTTIAMERNLSERALELFSTTYGLCWADSYEAAAYEQAHGQEYTQRVLSLISRSGCSFADAVLAVDSADVFLKAA